MLINLRNALMAGKRLPYDAEVEFLESTGTQWIDTGRPIPTDFWFDATIDITGTSYAYKTLLGARIGSSVNDYQFSFQSSNNYFLARYGNNSPQYNSPLQTGMTRIRVESGGKLYINESFALQLGVASPPTLNMYIFALNNNGAVSQQAQYIRLYSLKYGGLNEYHDLIPVRKGAVGYLYDRVSGKLFGNAGTGDFVLGQDVVPVEWLEGDGNSYIDLGIRPTAPEIDIDAEARYVGTSSVGLFSAGQASPRLEFYNWASTLQAYCGTYTSPVISLAVGDRISITTSNGNIVIKNITRGVTVNGTYTFNGQATETASIWGLHRSGAYSYIGKWRVFRAYVDSLKCTPVRVGTEGAMMDVLTRRIYRNQGTGAFGYGNDLKYPIPSE